jgi:uncharacterized protein (TIGR00297 family)
VTRNSQQPLAWQSKAVLLLVLPVTAASVILQSHWWLTQVPVVAWTAIGISTILGLVVWRLRAATPGAAATGALITASLMFSTTNFPYMNSWAHGALLPLLTVFVLTFAATRLGKRKKEVLGLAEDRKGRSSAQVAANLGVASLAAMGWATVGTVLAGGGAVSVGYLSALAALAEAAADTVSSEIGQVAGGTPRLITTLRKVEPGTDGGVTLAGTLAGILAAFIVSALGIYLFITVHIFFERWTLIGLVACAGVFGLLFDSLLGATLERRGWLNNDAVNLLSTAASAAIPTAGILWLASRLHI